MLGKSEQLLAETPKFSFEDIVIKHLQRSPEKMMTISHDQKNKKRKQS
jgi:muconolactone delta-isomerase